MFKVGQTYSRRKDIHVPFGGQRQGGISTPSEQPFIFLFTGEAGESYGYTDGWNGDLYDYVGEGQAGDMEFIRGNRAIRDHREDGKDLLLFQAMGHSQPVRYLGCYACASWEYGRGPDKDGTDRRIIIFHLAPTETIPDFEAKGATTPVQPPSLEELRRKAYEAAGTRTSNQGRQSSRQYRERSDAVRAYVLARAAGICESCGLPAPFSRTNGTPYLEPHHTMRLSDDGPDHPSWVGAVCPNCHKEIHYGAEGEERNRQLRTCLASLETV
jgi:5-methylcytosine-specific restriction protein A